ncbi:hypothetical protein AAC387_Pa05g2388 [Persea americana]
MPTRTRGGMTVRWSTPPPWPPARTSSLVKGGVGAQRMRWPRGWQRSNSMTVAAWVAEKQFYDYSSNACSGPDCTHYTQFVWRTTEQVGCAKIICDNGSSYITCEYNPPGNYVGARPY